MCCVVAWVTVGPVDVDLGVAVGAVADVARVVTAEVVRGDTPEETVGSVWVVGAVAACVEVGAVAVAGRREVWVGATGVAGELGEGPVELRSPVILGVSVVLGVAVVVLVPVEGEPVVGGGDVVVGGMHGRHVPSSWSKYSSWEQL